MSQGPCLNPNCSSQGRPHPHCQCYNHMAEGGEISGECSAPHREDCQYYLPNDSGDIFHGALVHQGLSGLIKNTSKSPLDSISQDEHRPIKSYISAFQKGSKKYQEGVEGAYSTPKKFSADPKQLESQLGTFQTEPEKMLDVGQNLGQHGAHLAYSVGAAQGYLNQIKPKDQYNGPLDKPSKPSKLQMQAYDQQVALVEQPMHIINKAKDGTLTSKDIHTVATVYPKFFLKLRKSLGEELINAKSKGKDVPYKERLSLSRLLGEPLDLSLMPQIAQAAIRANAPKQPPQPQGKKPKKASSEASIAQQQKVNDLYETATQSAAKGGKD